MEVDMGMIVERGVVRGSPADTRSSGPTGEESGGDDPREGERPALVDNGATVRHHESPGADFDARLARIESAMNQRPDRPFTFYEFGPLGIRRAR